MNDGCVVSPELAQAFFRSVAETFAFLRDYGATSDEFLEVWDGTDFQPTHLADLTADVFFAARVQYAARGWTARVEYDSHDFIINTVLELADGGNHSLLFWLRTSIARRGHPASYALWEWIEALGADAGAASDPGDADTPDRVAAGVRGMAGALRMHLPAILRDLPALLPEVEARRTRRMLQSKERDRVDRDRNVAFAAADAFRRRDFRRVVELLEPLEGRLAGSDRKKLEYARSRIASARDM